MGASMKLALPVEVLRGLNKLDGSQVCNEFIIPVGGVWTRLSAQTSKEGAAISRLGVRIC